MSQLLKDQTTLVLGLANRWSIAYAIAKAFRREGANLILTYQGDRQKDAVEELAEELGASRVLPCDVTQEADIRHLSEILLAEGEKLDTVVHSIAFANREDLARPFSETSREGFLLAHEVSCYSLIAVTRAVAPVMNDGGTIMTLSYLGSQRVITNYNVMGVAKAALEASVRYLAADLGPRNIRVNAISAGPIKPPRRAASPVSPSSWNTSPPRRRCAATRTRRKSPTPPSSWPVRWAAASPATSCTWMPATRSWATEAGAHRMFA
jgi:enoyl-[acyl-carrier protein] reductase I